MESLILINIIKITHLINPHSQSLRLFKTLLYILNILTASMGEIKNYIL